MYLAGMRVAIAANEALIGEATWAPWRFPTWNLALVKRGAETRGPDSISRHIQLRRAVGWIDDGAVILNDGA
jgi:hypothetical protein